MKNVIVFLVILVIAGLQGTGYGQAVSFSYDTFAFPQEAELNIESPNYPRFPQYGNTTTNLNRGTISLDISIYHYKDQDFDIPINLYYASNGFKTGGRTGIVGYGWQLSAGGYISREVRGLPDNESYTKLNSSDSPTWGFYFLHRKGIRWEQGNIVSQPFNMNTANYSVFFYDRQYETTPDQYHYSFMGYQGSFTLDANGKIHLYNTNTSSTNVKVEIDQEMASITLLMDNGYQYVFEPGETIPKFSNINWYTYCTWTLVSIKAPNGRQVRFNYSQWHIHNAAAKSDDALSTVYITTGEDYNRSVYAEPNSGLDISKTAAGKGDWQYGYYYLRTCYLESITIDDLKINFSYSAKDEFYNTVRKETYGNLKKLDKMEVVTSGGVRKMKECSFSYAKRSTFAGDRILFLDKLYLPDEGTYTMSYYDGKGSSSFPALGTLSSDHWGYYNGRSNTRGTFIPETTSDNLYNETIIGTGRNPDGAYSVAGMLKKIIYPTGGYTTYDYEANTYCRMVEKRNAGQTDGIYDMIVNKDKDCEAGGVRIKRIVDYNNGQKYNERTFSYLNDVNRSSGLLLYIPRYSIQYNCTLNWRVMGPDNKTYIRYVPASVWRKSPNGLISNNIPIGTHIIYDRVREERGDGSSILYTFDTYSGDKDITNPVYVQGLPVMPLKDAKVDKNGDYVDYLFKVVHTNYACLGNLLTKEFSGVEGFTEKSETYFYNYSQLPLADTIVIRAQSVYGYYISPHYVQNKTLDTKRINEHGYSLESVYEYNNCNQVIKESRQLDNSNYLVTRYSYLNEKSEPTSAEREMIAKNIINVPCEVYTASASSIYSNPSAEQVLKRRKLIYQKFGNLLKPVRLEEYRGAQYALQVEYQYDTQGNISQKRYKDGTTISYIWGYGGKYCVAQVKYCDLSAIYSLNSMRGLTFPLAGSLSVRQIDELYGLSESGPEIEVYEYDSYVGVTRMTDQRKVSTYFGYDSYGRLVSKKNHSGDVLEEGKYHIVTETN